MDEINNNYYDIACSEYKFLEHNINRGFYNQTLPMIQQVAEKMLKSVIINLFLLDNDKILREHRLDKIYGHIRKSNNSICNKYTLNTGDLCLLSSYYFDCRYPGDNFIVATKEQESESMEILKDVITYVNNIRQDFNDTFISLYEFGEKCD